MEKQLLHDTMGAMIHLLRLHRCACEAEIKKQGIHHSQHKMLMFIARREKNAPTQVEIAQHFHISPAAVAVTLKKLEAAGYVKRHARSGDMRNNEVTLTPRGKKVRETSENTFDSLDRQMFKGLEQKDILSLKENIDTMIKNLSKGEKE